MTVQFVIDEAAPIGRLRAFNTAIGIGRGYRIRLIVIYQSLGQVRQCFPEDNGQTVLSNTVQCYFGANDFQTAEHIFNMLGDRTIIVDSGGSGDGISRQNADNGNSQSVSHNNNYNWSQLAQPLLKPAQILRLGGRWCITFKPGTPPIMTYLTRYYEKQPKPLGFRKMVIDTICLFLLSVMIAFLVTGVFLQR
jgi:type IV secretion system protein VirD4